MMPYAPMWCEENIWQRVVGATVDLARRHVVFISNASRTVACWSQRAAPPGEAVVWDYHVVLLTRGEGGVAIEDPDCTVGERLPFAAWRRATFPLGDALPAALRPRFRVAPAALWLADFASDRSHMRGADGGWLAPPPPWEAPRPPGAEAAPHTLPAWWDVVSVDSARGITCDLKGLERFVAHASP
jgi:hypothetical protein